MDPISDQNYLKNEQYRQGDHLDARIQLHRRYSVNPTVYFEWMYDLLDLQAGMKVMEVGCGTGELWRTNLPRLPDVLPVTMLDLSAGMAAAARATLNHDARFRFAAADAQHLPFSNGQFEQVIANYMLYHVPDIPLAVRELRRVLIPGGRLCAATNGRTHMIELHDLMQRFGLRVSQQYDFTARYGLENAPRILGDCFDHVEVVPFVDRLFVTDAAALMDYIRSMVGIWHFDPEGLTGIEQWVAGEIRDKGGFTIHKSGGVVLAW